jgi:hypothetical protein
MGYVVEKEMRQVFFGYLSFPCQAFHRPLHTHHHPSLLGGWYNRPFSGLSNSGIGSTAPQEITIIKK